MSALLGAGVLVARPSGQAAVIPGTRIGTAELDVRLTELMARAKVPGLAVAVIDSGRIVHRKAYGLADIDQKRSLTTDTIMYGASLTKAAFAYSSWTRARPTSMRPSRRCSRSLCPSMRRSPCRQRSAVCSCGQASGNAYAFCWRPRGD